MKAATTTLPRWLDFPSLARLPGPHRVVCGTSRAARKPNRIGSHATFEEARSHKPRSGWMFTKDGHLFGGMWGSLRSDTLCYFVAPLVPMQFLGDNWEDTPHTVTYTTVTHMQTHLRAHTHNHQKTTNSRNGNRDRAGVTGDGACVEILGTSTRFSKQGNGTHSVEIQQLQTDAAVQLWQWQRGRGDRKINIILETLVIHFLSHLLGHLCF